MGRPQHAPTGPHLRPSQSGEFWETPTSCDREVSCDRAVVSERALRIVPPAFPTPYSPLRILFFIGEYLKPTLSTLASAFFERLFIRHNCLFLSRQPDAIDPVIMIFHAAGWRPTALVLTAGPTKQYQRVSEPNLSYHCLLASKQRLEGRETATMCNGFPFRVQARADILKPSRLKAP